MDYLLENTILLKNIINKAMIGKFRLYPKSINVQLTNRCNLFCIMCHAFVPEFTNRTYNNDLPRSLEINQYKKIIFDPSFFEKILYKFKLRNPSGLYRSGTIISFMDAESLLNPDCYEIIKWTKNKFPSISINILSNGTIPPKIGKEAIIKDIEFLGFSIDGCSAETFEKIRTPAKFDNVINNIKLWKRAKEKYNSQTKFKMSTVLSAMNIHELPGIVKMAGELGFWQVYCQPIVLGPKRLEYLRDMKLECVSKEIGNKFITDAFKEAEKNGILLSISESIKKIFLPNNIEEKHPHYDYSLNRFCDKLWDGTLALNEDNELMYACCFMKKEMIYKVLEDYKIPKKGNLIKIYNSKGFWNLRRDMLDGKCLDTCKECTIGASNYFRLKKEPFLPQNLSIC